MLRIHIQIYTHTLINIAMYDIYWLYFFVNEERDEVNKILYRIHQDFNKSYFSINNIYLIYFLLGIYNFS